MSRGLGAIQREILDTLDEARLKYLGPNGYTWYLNCYVSLRPDVYDMRATADYLMRLRGMNWHEGPFQASLSRAIHSLVKRGILTRLRMVPITRCLNTVRRCDLIHEHHGELFLEYGTPQIRFVTGPKCFKWSARIRSADWGRHEYFFGED